VFKPSEILNVNVIWIFFNRMIRLFRSSAFVIHAWCQNHSSVITHLISIYHSLLSTHIIRHSWIMNHHFILITHHLWVINAQLWSILQEIALFLYIEKFSNLRCLQNFSEFQEFYEIIRIFQKVSEFFIKSNSDTIDETEIMLS